MHDCAKKASNFFETKWSETEKQLLKDQAAAARKRNKPKPKPRSKPQPKPESPVPREYEIAGSVEAMQERELKGMETLQEYIVECGGKKNCLQGWYCVIEMRREGKTQGTSDMFYFSPKVSVLFISLSIYLSISPFAFEVFIPIYIHSHFCANFLPVLWLGACPRFLLRTKSTALALKWRVTFV